MASSNTNRCRPERRNVSACLHRWLTCSSTTVENFDPNYENIDIRICRTHEELDECVHLQKIVWQFNDLDTVPRRLFIVSTKTGGVVLGAYASRNAKPLLVGFVWALPGIHPETNAEVFLHVEMLAVHPIARGHGVGKMLIEKMRDHALIQNIKKITATFDPTDSQLAYLYINRYGGTAQRYTPDYYGASSSSLHRLSTDRLHVEWGNDSLNRHQHLDPLEHTNRIEEIRVPASMAQWKRLGDARAMQVQRDIRDKLTIAFAQGLTIIGFQREEDRTGTYQLGYCAHVQRNMIE